MGAVNLSKEVPPVFWLFGVCGAGKTSLAEMLVYHLKFNLGYMDTAWLDGDYIRSCSNDKDYSRDGRINNVNKIRNMALGFQSTGVINVVSTCTPYQSMRTTNRNSIKNYHEILIATDKETLCLRKQKPEFALALENKIDNYTGINGQFDEPIDPDLVINNNGEFEHSLAILQKYAKDVLSFSS